MPSAYHVCIDTNVLVRLITQGMPGCEIEHWEKLKEFVRSGRVTLLHPEVVQLELQKKWRQVPAKIGSETKELGQKMLAELRVNEMWTEVRDLRRTVEECLATYAKRKEVESKSRYDEIVEFLRQEPVRQLRIDQDILLRTQRRALSGGLANPDRKSEADCMLIEQLAAHFDFNGSGESTLLLCSANTTDFAVEVKKKQFAIHPEISDALPKTSLFLDLKTLVKFIDEQREVEVVPADEVAKAAREEDVERVTREDVVLGLMRGLPNLGRSSSEIPNVEFFDRFWLRSKAVKYADAMRNVSKLSADVNKSRKLLNDYRNAAKAGQNITDEMQAAKLKADEFRRASIEARRLRDEMLHAKNRIENFQGPAFGAVMEATKILNELDEVQDVAEEVIGRRTTEENNTQAN